MEWTRIYIIISRHNMMRRLSTSSAQIASNKELADIVHQFSPGIDYAFGYGSGVFRQAAVNTDPGNMIDIILAVDNPQIWHEHNLQQHTDHYSSIARLGGPRFISWVQTKFGARLYFHPFVNMNINNIGQRQLKYGIVSSDDMIRDLIHWDYLYLAGRMHKPIVNIELSPPSSNEKIKSRSRTNEIDDAQRTNLLSAVSASLLLHSSNSYDEEQSSSISTSNLYNTIAGLSYSGDVRMQIGAEDPNKVNKLVKTPGMMERWDEKYLDTISNLQSMGLLSMVARNSSSISTNLETNLSDIGIRKQLVQNLPLRLRNYSDLIVGSQGSLILRQELVKIVAPAARSQSIKGFFTAGVVKSWRYAMAKFSKGVLRK
jgi:translocator assembly and maintenance protein 41